MVMEALKLRKAARKMTRLSWGCCGSSTQDISNCNLTQISRRRMMMMSGSVGKVQNVSDDKESGTLTVVNNNNNNNKSLCAICLEALSCWKEADIFTSEECSHAFHFNCIASNVRHGSVTCPICRAHWTNPPRHLPHPHVHHDPILRILDDSIATFRHHRRSSSTHYRYRYDDDDPTIQLPNHHHISRLQFALLPLPPLSCGGLLLSVKLAQQEATDVVLVVSPTSSSNGIRGGGPHLLKQAMSLVVFSLRSIDRLAVIVTTSSSSSTPPRVLLPLRRMTWNAKRTALQLIDTLCFTVTPPAPPMGSSSSSGMKKGIKILEDRTHKNPHSHIIYLSFDRPPPAAGSGWCYKQQHQLHHFHFDVVGMSGGLLLVMQRFEEFLARAIGGIIRDTHLRIGGEEDGQVVRLGELRGGEERRIPLIINTQSVSVIFSYIEAGGGGVDCLRTGEIQVSLLLEDKIQSSSGVGGGRRSSNHDIYMARRWAKHLHGYKP